MDQHLDEFEVAGDHARLIPCVRCGKTLRLSRLPVDDEMCQQCDDELLALEDFEQ